MKLITIIALASTVTFAGGAASISLWDVLSEPPLHLVARFASAPADQSVGETNPAPSYGAWGFDISGVDVAAKPGDSFFDYANGAWDARTAIPADKPRFGMLDALRDKVQEQLRAIIDDVAKSAAAPDSEAGKIGAVYNAFMDEARIEVLDAAPIADDLARIRDARTKTDIAALMGHSSETRKPSTATMSRGC